MQAGSFVVFFLNGLTQAMLLFLIASGLSIIFGVLGVLNFAHGSLYMLGAYFAFQFMQWTGNFWLALAMAPLVVAAVGTAAEVWLLRPVYGRDVTFQLLLTFGMILVATDAAKMVWGVVGKTVSEPALFSGSVHFLDRSYPVYNLFLIASGLLVALGLWLLLTRTRWGKIIRAASQDREMANALGIDVPRLFTLVFAFGAWLGGVGGVMAGPIRHISLTMDVEIIVRAFAVVVIGGLGSLPGALLGAFLIGEIQSFGIWFIPQFEIVLMFILMAVILIVRPRGLLGKAE
ncbi:MAG: branched-chain amino acid ABC transporter permease [Anaerolineae bacterium]